MIDYNQKHIKGKRTKEPATRIFLAWNKSAVGFLLDDQDKYSTSITPRIKPPLVEQIEMLTMAIDKAHQKRVVILLPNKNLYRILNNLRKWKRKRFKGMRLNGSLIPFPNIIKSLHTAISKKKSVEIKIVAQKNSMQQRLNKEVKEATLLRPKYI